jgi:hypothetical protein
MVWYTVDSATAERTESAWAIVWFVSKNVLRATDASGSVFVCKWQLLYLRQLGLSVELSCSLLDLSFALFKKVLERFGIDDYAEFFPLEKDSLGMEDFIDTGVVGDNLQRMEPVFSADVVRYMDALEESGAYLHHKLVPIIKVQDLAVFKGLVLPAVVADYTLRDLFFYTTTLTPVEPDGGLYCVLRPPAFSDFDSSCDDGGGFCVEMEWADRKRVIAGFDRVLEQMQPDNIDDFEF